MKLRISHILTAIATFALGIIVAAVPPGDKPETHACPEAPGPAVLAFPPEPLKMLKPPTAYKPEKYEPAVPQIAELTPYEIERFINLNSFADMRSIWERLKVKPAFGPSSEREGLETFMQFCDHCEAESYEYDLDGELGPEIILRIANGSEQCRYLVFNYDGNEKRLWKFLGNVDHDFGRYEMPQHSFLLSGGKSYLVIRVQMQAGSGIDNYSNRLFTIYRGKLVEIGEFPSDGHRTMNGYFLDREFNGRILSCDIQNGVARTEVEFEVAYTAWTEDNQPPFDLITDKRKAVFVTRLNSAKTSLDAGRSAISQKEIDTLYDLDAFDDRNFFKLYAKELNAIKSKKGTRDYKWWKGLQGHNAR